MSSFRVGQLVKCVRGAPQSGRKAPCRDVNPGDLLIICGTVSQPNAGFNPDGDWYVSARLIDSHIFGMAPSYCFEPATDSYDKAEWADCLWQPNNATVESQP